MTRRLAYLWRHHRALLIAFTAALAITLFFALRAVVFFVYWSDPIHRDQPLEGWMTPRYIAHSHHLPLEAVAGMLAISPEQERRPTLEKLAKRRGVPVEVLINDLDTAIAAWKAAHP
ncbi:MAG: hypothetical protein KDK00_00305 [Rhodobacteraceae bacterium]|nr:hypothetical protein [Paracoccaceae bacterium]